MCNTLLMSCNFLHYLVYHNPHDWRSFPCSAAMLLGCYFDQLNLPVLCSVAAVQSPFRRTVKKYFIPFTKYRLSSANKIRFRNGFRIVNCEGHVCFLVIRYFGTDLRVCFWVWSLITKWYLLEWCLCLVLSFLNIQCPWVDQGIR